MLIYAQAESSQTLWLTCVVKLAVLSLWKLDALVWRADGVSCDFSQRVVSLWYHLMLPTVLVFWFCLVHFILLMSWWCSARPIRLRRSLTAEQPGLALFLSRAWLHCEGGEEKPKSHPEQTVLYLHHFQPAAAGNQLYTTCSAPNRHTEYRGQLLVALRDRCFPHKVSETQTDEIWRNAGAHYEQTSFCLKIWRFMTDFKSLTALWPITHFPMWLIELAECSGVSALYLLHVYHAPIKHIEAPC